MIGLFLDDLEVVFNNYEILTLEIMESSQDNWIHTELHHCRSEFGVDCMGLLYVGLIVFVDVEDVSHGLEPSD